MNVCCENCFESEVAKEFIRDNGFLDGECDYCGNSDSSLIETGKLKELFDPLISLYKSAEDRINFDRQMEEPGHRDYESLAALIYADWEIFNGKIDLDNLNKLLDDILHADVDPSEWNVCVYSACDAWIRCEDCIYGDKPEDTWRWFATHLKRERRFIIDEGPDGEIVRPERWIGSAIETLNAVKLIPVDSIFYRGRIGSANSIDMRGLEPLPIGQMGAPPSHLAKGSRASSEGIPVLYAGSNADVAVAEAGRFPGAVVSVREIRNIVDLRVVNLANITAVSDPLGISNLPQVLRYKRLLKQLNFELSRPVHPDESSIEYIPTQYLSEAIKVAGYDGLYFESAMQPGGMNLVVFDPDKIQVTDKGNVYHVESVSFRIKPILPKSR